MAADAPPAGGSGQPHLIGKNFPAGRFATFVARFPGLLLLLSSAVVVGLALGAAFKGPTVAAEVGSFIPTTSAAQKDQLYIEERQRKWSDQFSQNAFSLRSPSTKPSNKNVAGRLTVVFQINRERLQEVITSSTSDARMISTRNMAHVKAVTEALLKVRQYDGACWAPTDDAFCAPLSSLGQYFYPGVPTNRYGGALFSFTGLTDGPQDEARTQSTIVTNPNAAWFMERGATPTTATMTRLTVHFGEPVLTTGDTLGPIPIGAQLQLSRDMVKAASSIPHAYIETKVGGFKVFDAVVSAAVADDSRWLFISIVFVGLATRIHAHSWMLAIVSVVHVVAVAAGGTLLFVSGSGTTDLPILSAILFYAVLAGAVAGQMVLFDAFKQSGKLSDRTRSVITVAQRIAHMYRHAGSGITATSACVFFIFTACRSITDIPAVRDFAGLLMASIALNWFALFFMYPAAITCHHFYFSHRRRNLQKQKELRAAPTHRSRIASQVALHREINEVFASNGLPTSDDMIAQGEVNTAKELVARTQRLGPAWRTNLLPHWRLLSRVKAAVPTDSSSPAEVATGTPSTAGSGGRQGRYGEESAAAAADMADAEESAWAPAPGQRGNRRNGHTNGPNGHNGSSNGGPSLAAAAFQAEEAAGFDVVDEGGFVVDKDAELPLAAKCVRILSLNSDTVQQADATALQQHVANLGIIDTVGNDRLGAFGAAAGIEAFRPDTAEGRAAVAHVSRLAAHHIESHGWAMNIPLPAIAAETSNRTREKPPERRWLHQRFALWLEDRFVNRSRQHCLGLCGARVETTNGRRDRIERLAIKREGPNRIERFLGGPFTRAINDWFFIVVLCLGVLILACVILVAFVPVASTVPSLLPPGNAIERFEAANSLFGGPATCDYCAPFFYGAGASLTFADANQCAGQLGRFSLFDRPNECGSCIGDHSCRGCDGTSASVQLDGCLQCVDAADPRRGQCSSCVALNTGIVQLPHCSPCAANSGGPSCGVTCPCQGSARGTCNALTGRCDCHHTRLRGFYAGSTCDSCESGFDGSECDVECADSSMCTCNFESRCVNCPNGLAGETCTTQDANVCDRQGGRIVAGSCSCNAGYGGPRCAFRTACNSVGVIYTAAEVHASIANRCVCAGQTFGPACEYCRCYNGGTCQPDGSCACLGPFTGPDCTMCPFDCSHYGLCAPQWRPNQYPYYQCRQLFCTQAEVLAQTATTASCRRCDADRVVSGCNGTAQSCLMDFYNSTFPPSKCTCRGYLTGVTCSYCNVSAAWWYRFAPSAAASVRCDANGDLVGCDGLSVSPFGSRLAVVDSCGVCGGTSSTCIGCDGVVNSGRVVDECGVCGGSNSCPLSERAAGNPIDILVEVSSYRSIEDNIRGLRDFCTLLSGQVSATLARPTSTTCFLSRLDDYKNSLNATNRSTTAQNLVNFVVASQLQDLLGMKNYGRFNFNAPAIDFVLFRFSTSSLYSKDSPTSVLEDKLARLKAVVARVAAETPTADIHSFTIASPAFVALSIRKAIFNDCVAIICVACAIVIGIVATYVCSPRIALATAVVVLATVLWALGTVAMLQTSLGPAEMVTVLLIVGITAGDIVYMAEGYAQELHASQSHLLAEATTRRENLKGMFRRTGIAVGFSSLVLFCSGLLLLRADVRVLRTCGAMLAINAIAVLPITLVGFGGLMAWFGPHKTWRSPLMMLLFGSVSVVLCLAVGLAATFARPRSL